MDEIALRKVKESILRHGDSFWTDVDCDAFGVDDKCPECSGDPSTCVLRDTVDCPGTNVALLEDIISCLNKDDLDLQLVPYTDLDRALGV